MRIAVIGVPWNSAGGMGGEARAPDALRAAGLLGGLAQVHDVADYGNVLFPAPVPQRDLVSGIIAPEELALMATATRAEVARAFAEQRFPLVLGGECPLLLGCLAAARGPEGRRVGLCFLDGHEDAYPPHASPTGESADMELGIAMGRSTVPECAEFVGTVQASDVAILGARDRIALHDHRVDSVAASVAAYYDPQQLRQQGIAVATTDALARIRKHVPAWWLHLDLDVLSGAALPSVRYPQPGGLRWGELEDVLRVALLTPGLLGWNITIYNPDFDPMGLDARRIAWTVVHLLAHAQARMA
ncbi:arginase family protein [Candidatus Uhrbacteria bacterium]|nr:arginase family protein [Candidatus Uhrbacteria bacterium]